MLFLDLLVKTFLMMMTLLSLMMLCLGFLISLRRLLGRRRGKLLKTENQLTLLMKNLWMLPLFRFFIQTRAQAGLGFSKPPKNRLRTAGPSNVSRPVPSGPSDVSQAVSRPKSVVCKKKSGSCTHEVVFGEHYNKAAWNKYADHVKSAKSTTVIDEDYIP